MCSPLDQFEEDTVDHFLPQQPSSAHQCVVFSSLDIHLQKINSRDTMALAILVKTRNLDRQIGIIPPHVDNVVHPLICAIGSPALSKIPRVIRAPNSHCFYIDIANSVQQDVFTQLCCQLGRRLERVYLAQEVGRRRKQRVETYVGTYVKDNFGFSRELDPMDTRLLLVAAPEIEPTLQHLGEIANHPDICLVQDCQTLGAPR